MKRLFALIALLAAPAFAGVTTNQPAPDFTAQSATGETVSLSDYAGKIVVLEWTNHGCPFVKKFYEAGEMQRLQQEAAGGGIIWLRVISSAPGKQGHLSASEAMLMAGEQKVGALHTLLDSSGVLGKLYGAKTTPHMFVINPEGVLIYQGAIDDNPSTKSEDIAGATNYVTAALAALKDGALPAVQESKPYGCSVKY